MDKPWIRPPAYSEGPMLARGFVEIGRWVRAHRWALGMSQQHLGRLSGVDQTIISRLENGRLRSLRFWRLAAIIGVLCDDRPPQTRWT